MKKVAVIGSVNEDFNIQCDNFPKGGETIISESLSKQIGGKGYNQALTIARQEVPVYFIGAVGNDDFGQKIKAISKEENINVDHLYELENKNSGNAIVLINQEAENCIIVNPGTNSLLDVSLLKAKKEIILTMDYVVLQGEIPIESIQYIIDLCHNTQTKVVLNPAPYHPDMRKIDGKKVHYIIPNEIELAQLVENDENDTEQNIKDLHNMGYQNIIVTLGSKGSLYSNQKTIKKIKPQKVKAVDTTGAGDSFVGSFVAELSRETSMESALNYATTVAAHVVSHRGTYDAIPYRKDLK